MAAYVGVVGWIAVGFCAAAVVFVVSLVTYQIEYGTFGSRALSPVQALRLPMPLAMLNSIPGPIVEAEPLPRPLAQRRPRANRLDDISNWIWQNRSCSPCWALGAGR
jgi:hypothetical protein